MGCEKRRPEKKGVVKSRAKTNKTLSFETDLTKTQITLHGDETYDDYKKQLKNFKLSEQTNLYMPESIASAKLRNLPKIKHVSSDDQEFLKVNDISSDKRRSSNCFQCTIAYEMRRRGYDVQANTNYGGRNFEYLHAFNVKDSFRVKTNTKSSGTRFPTSEETARECFDQISAQCLEYGEGARGAIMMTFPLGGGHTMNWVVENGEFKLIDAQRGGEDGYDTFSKTKFDVEVVRLDNAELLPGCTDFVEKYKQPIDIGKSISDGAKKITSTINKIGRQTVSTVSDAIDFGKKSIEKLFSKLRR